MPYAFTENSIAIIGILLKDFGYKYFRRLALRYGGQFT